MVTTMVVFAQAPRIDLFIALKKELHPAWSRGGLGSRNIPSPDSDKN